MIDHHENTRLPWRTSISVGGTQLEILAGTVGSYIGATLMYWASRWLGRPLMLRYGKYIFVPPAKLEQAERSRIVEAL